MFPDEEPVNNEVSASVESATKLINVQNRNPFAVERFQDSKLFYALPDSIRSNPPELSLYIKNSSMLENALRSKDLFGEEVEIPETVNASGGTRRSESGQKVNIDYLRSRGIDPSKVLLFRVTQQSDAPVPEYYWTTDYFETQKGLSAEISAEKRATSITLVADMQTVAGERGLIRDINDDNGLAVRQIDTSPFDQTKAIGVVK